MIDRTTHFGQSDLDLHTPLKLSNATLAVKVVKEIKQCSNLLVFKTAQDVVICLNMDKLSICLVQEIKKQNPLSTAFKTGLSLKKARKYYAFSTRRNFCNLATVSCNIYPDSVFTNHSQELSKFCSIGFFSIFKSISM